MTTNTTSTKFPFLLTKNKNNDLTKRIYATV
jgi:hypothetical protein